MTLLGVDFKPSRSGSSPTHSMIVFIASSAFSSEIF